MMAKELTTKKRLIAINVSDLMAHCGPALNIPQMMWGPIRPDRVITIDAEPDMIDGHAVILLDVAPARVLAGASIMSKKRPVRLYVVGPKGGCRRIPSCDIRNAGIEKLRDLARKYDLPWEE